MQGAMPPRRRPRPRRSGRRPSGPRRRPRRPARRPTPVTACRHSRSSPSASTASTGSSANRRSWSRCGTCTPPTACPRPVRARDPGAVPGLPGHAPGRSPSAAGAVPVRRPGPQGGRGGQRRHPGLHRPAAGPRRAGPAVPAGQGGHRLGLGGPPAQEPLQAARRAGGPGAADDAGGQRHLPGLDQGPRRQPALLLAPAARHEGLGRGRSDGPLGLNFYAGVCGWTLARATPARGSGGDRRLPGEDDQFDRSITDFSKRYAEQNERDYQAFIGGGPIRTAGGTGRRPSAAQSRVSPTSQPWATRTQTTKTSTAMIRIDQTLRGLEPERVDRVRLDGIELHSRRPRDPG